MKAMTDQVTVMAFLATAATFPLSTLESGHRDRFNLHLESLRSVIMLEAGDPVRALAEFPREILEPLAYPERGLESRGHAA
jgi:hypothetical protein